MKLGIPLPKVGISNLISFNSDRPKRNAAAPATTYIMVVALSIPRYEPTMAIITAYNVMVMVSPSPKRMAIKKPFLYPFPMLKGTITKTRGNVQGSVIIERPAAYERVAVTVVAGLVAR